MKQKEKSMLTKYKIIQAALKEFSEYNYDNSSINRICTNGNIPKGVMYHYFKDKDELYLLCIKYCYDSICNYYKTFLKDYNAQDDWKIWVKKYFEIRYKFFCENPLLKKIYFHTILRGPVKLSKEIENIHLPFKQLNHDFALKVLSNVRLKKNLSIDEVIKLLDIIQNMLNEKFHSKLENDNLDSLSIEYEEEAIKWVDILLYGILEDNKNN